MTMLLTDQQREQVEAATGQEPAEVLDPATQKLYRLVSAEQYEEYERLKDDAEQAAWYEASACTLGRRLAEQDRADGEPASAGGF